MEQFQTDSTQATSFPDAPAPPTQVAPDPSPNLGASKKPRVWTVFVAAVIMMVVGLGATAVYIIIAGVILVASGGSRDTARITELVLGNPNILIPSFAMMGISALFVTAICSLLSPERVMDRLSLRSSRLGVKGYVAAVAVVFGTSMAAGQVAGLFNDGNSPTLKLIARQLRSANPFMFAIAVLIIAGLAPVAEEAFFRGYMQTRLRGRWGATWAIAISAIAFGLFHADPVQTPFAIAVGVALGYVAERAGSIRPAIVCHMINNLVAVIVARSPENETKPVGQWIVFVVAIVVSVSGVLWFHRDARAKPPAHGSIAS